MTVRTFVSADRCEMAQVWPNGKITVATREDPDDVWGPPREVDVVPEDVW